MTENVIPFPKPPGSETPNDLLDAAKDALESVIVIGWDNDGDFYWRTTASCAEVNWMLDILKTEILSPEVLVELDDA